MRRVSYLGGLVALIRNTLARTVVLIGITVSFAASASSLDDGVTAFDRSDFKTAFAQFKPLAESGNPEAQYYLSLLYERGGGVKRDDAIALQWLRKSIDGGSTPAVWKMGWRYGRGIGITKDTSEAWKCFFKAADTAVWAQTNIGLLALGKDSPVVKPDMRYYHGLEYLYFRPYYLEAAKWFQKAAAQGDAEAEYELGILYSQGYGVLKDERQAVVWLRKAAMGGSRMAQSELGWLYKTGELGVKPDKEEAYFWLQLSTSQNFYHYIDPKAKEVAKQLTAEEVAAIEKRIAAWQPSPDAYVPRHAGKEACSAQDSRECDISHLFE